MKGGTSSVRTSLWQRAVEAAESLVRRGITLTYATIADEMDATTKQAADAACKAKLLGLWPFVVILDRSSERLRSAVEARWDRARWEEAGEDDDDAPMDLEVLEQIRASKGVAARRVDVRVCKLHAPK